MTRPRSYIRYLAPLLSSLAACTADSGHPDDELALELDTGKADDTVVRPFGTFRAAPSSDASLPILLVLKEDRTYHAMEHADRCSEGDCVEIRNDGYRFATSHDRRFIVLSHDGEHAQSFEYELEGSVLRLRDTRGEDWVVMHQADQMWCETASDCALQPYGQTFSCSAHDYGCEANTCHTTTCGTNDFICLEHAIAIDDCHAELDVCIDELEQIFPNARDEIADCCSTDAPPWEYCDEL